MTFELACKKAIEILADRYEFTELESAFFPAVSFQAALQ